MGPKRTPAAEENEDIKKSLQFLSQDVNDIRIKQDIILKLVDEVTELRMCIQERDKKIGELERKVEDLEQYSRLNDVIVTGLKVQPRSYAHAAGSESASGDPEAGSVEEQVVDFLASRDIHLDKNSIEACHPLPAKRDVMPAVILSVSLDVHGDRMTWRFAPYLFLIVFSRLIDLSKGGCNDYLTEEQWENNIVMEMVDLVIPKNVMDVAECTFEKYSRQKTSMDNVRGDCFNKRGTEKNEDCTPAWNATVHRHHLMCLLAMASHKSINGCEYDSVCPLFGFTPPVPTTPSTTTSPLAASLGVTAENAKLENEQASKSSYVFTLEVLVGLFSSLSLVLPVAVYFYMRRQTRQLDLPPMNSQSRWENLELLQLQKVHGSYIDMHEGQPRGVRFIGCETFDGRKKSLCSA
ncbi:uncharacterized protein LOC133541048 isoform X3 [Nerophis ophidion]|uniref:uncharacterized protein LOC133541048 isoform X3 n=1 Tax=Nerophis ophidion TaxID=159077 RepID=UPI002ADF1AA3|nr:uncharacterized protein LOC133541048 isoform X3 [Nerophis ophidion]